MPRMRRLLPAVLLMGSVGCGQTTNSPAQLTTSQKSVEIGGNHTSSVTDASPSATVAQAETKVSEVVAAPIEEQRDVALYVPVEADFHVAYLADDRNREKQTQAEYWRWVKAFYHGELLITGWLRQSESIIKMCHQSNDHPAVVGLLNDAGRKLAAEWSKDGSVRKINNLDLQTWGARISKCSSSPQESTECVKNALRQILDEIERKLNS